MINVRDLHFHDDILPLLDFLQNEYSRKALLQLLSDVPQNVEEIHLRQNIIKCYLDNERFFAPFSYSRMEFSQVYGWFEDKKARETGLQGVSLRIHLVFARLERSREKGGLSQIYIFLHRVGNFYFSGLDPAIFPESFRGKIVSMTRMMTELQVEKYHDIARKRGFTTAEVVKLLGLVDKKIRDGRMDRFWQDFFIFEAYFSLAKGIRKHRLTFPVFTHDEFVIDGLYHPLLTDPVKNNVAMSKTVTLITGPNMSGKSTLLKSIGLCVYMAHLGLAVPAGKCELPFFDVISVAINLNDDLTNGYSHFMAEIKTLKQVVIAARENKRCFAVFDELFRGTNIEDALAVSKTTITGLASFPGCSFLISTHLHQLEQAIDLAAYSIGTGYIECNLEGGIPVFTYRLKAGWSDLKIGQIIFEQEGLNELLKRDQERPGARRRD